MKHAVCIYTESMYGHIEKIKKYIKILNGIRKTTSASTCSDVSRLKMTVYNNLQMKKTTGYVFFEEVQNPCIIQS